MFPKTPLPTNIPARTRNIPATKSKVRDSCNIAIPNTIAAIGLSVRYKTVVVDESQRRAHMKSENCTAPPMVPKNTTAIHPLPLNAGRLKPPCVIAIVTDNEMTAKIIANTVTKSGP